MIIAGYKKIAHEVGVVMFSLIQMSANVARASSSISDPFISTSIVLEFVLPSLRTDF